MVLERRLLAEVCRQLRVHGKRIVFTNGCFDLLHLGHVRYLESARQLGDILVVGVNTDTSVRHLKGMLRPLRPEGERAALVAALKPVDFVTLFEEETPESLIAELRPDVLVKGGDYAREHIAGADLVESWGGTVVIVPYVKGYSTTAVVEDILRRYCSP
ncbi:MAG: D-glycero-beta-D-manno-heptose 1-phosphate adenylyltransferase [Candidatus Kapabacteria bacterium]|nr:D-glycero-beta-D-manno-heptose 1-phosphate adenylyltransferase [Candidatus Kapabacteria bacterium]MDW7996072.1 D-glycero-beta-D-manno-heptose 1-phosphate adenylyltransferase [Bacteroidota bacterium]MDW8224910.1 D-glycero-beta-D-manno-heptose 1-phosphate adenylyltransferase [Bacteroidota bacterium]